MPLEYDIETMGDINNDPILLSIGAVCGDIALKIADKLKTRPAYRHLTEAVKSDKLPSYFQRTAAIEIYPFIAQLMIHKRRGGREGVWLPKTGVFSLLRECWPADEAPVIEDKKKELNWQIMAAREKIKRRLKSGLKYFRRPAKSLTPPAGPVIALHYVEGFDLSRRSDITWLENSGIRPEQVMVYFDGPDNRTGKPVKEEALKSIEARGMRWVALKKGIVARKDAAVWFPSGRKHHYCLKYRPEIKTSIDKWTAEKGRELVRQIAYWQSFYKDFNVRLLVLPEQSEALSIAQGIAFDLLGKEGGFTVGKQRSDMWGHIKHYVGHHTKDIQFVWNRRAVDYFQPVYNRVRSQVVTGYTYERSFNENKEEKLANKKKLTDNGAKFIIALFDQGHGGKTYFSSDDLEAFYRAFLEWVLADKTVGIIIKSKKAYILRTLPEVLPLLKQAQTTGRYINLTNEFGRLPTDASMIADLAVGWTMNSAVTEAVIAGCRGIHYLKAFPKSSDYFKWGYGKIVFNDLDQMMTAIKRYKRDPASQPELGDWKNHIDQLDPFRDGRAGERMGEYLGHCLEGFGRGLEREAVLRQANDKYAARWGKDKMITLGKGA